MLILNYKNESGEKIGDVFFKKILGKFEKVLSACAAEIGLTLIKDSHIKRLNRDYRGKDMATDVLSFAYLEDEPGGAVRASVRPLTGDAPFIVGDIFISVETAKRQAKSHSHSLKKELEILFVHGLLHLFGFGHETDSEEEEMENFAKKILS